MVLSVITALVCFVAAIIMFSSYYRKMALLRPMAVYLIFEGAWIMLSYILTEIYPTTTIPDYIQSAGTLVIVLYYIFILLMTQTKSKRKRRKPEDK